MPPQDFGGLVSEDSILGFPPLHIHHGALTPVPGTLGTSALTFAPDYLCTAQPDDSDVEEPTSCLVHDREPHGVHLTFSPKARFIMLINDVRPKPSPPMTWFVQLSFHVTRPDALARVQSQALSQILPFTDYTHDPGRVPFPGVNAFNVLLVPTERESFFYYTGCMPQAGKLAADLVRLHSHDKLLFQGALLFQGRPIDIGLGDYASLPNPILPAEVGLADNRAVRAAILHAASAGAGRLLCTAHAEGSTAFVSGAFYDRKTPVSCSGWAFEQGAPFTSIGFFGRASEAHVSACGASGCPSYAGTVGEEFSGMHLDWTLFYVAADGLVHDGAMRTSRTPCTGAMANYHPDEAHFTNSSHALRRPLSSASLAICAPALAAAAAAVALVVLGQRGLAKAGLGRDDVRLL